MQDADPAARLILGGSPAAAALRDFARRAAAVDAPVLIVGETGTGKGVLARTIHACSPRAARDYVAVNCAAIPETLFESAFFGHVRGAFTGAHQAHRGYFEQADGGTLFLDEIGELPLHLQAKLLTALEDGEIRRVGAERTVAARPRLVAATSADLRALVLHRRFRRDLYHRLLVLACEIPPLRHRAGDVAFLAHHFLAEAARRYHRPARRLDDAALRRLEAHAWTGNVRELAHAVEAAVLACDGDRVRARDLPPLHEISADFAAAPADAAHAPAGYPGAVGAAPPPPPLPPHRRYAFHGTPDEERRRIAEALLRCHGNRTHTATTLGMARNTLRQKLREHGLEHGTERRAGVAPAPLSRPAMGEGDDGAQIGQ